MQKSKNTLNSSCENLNLFLKGEIMSMAQLKYKRVLLKISGEAAGGRQVHFGFDFDVVSKVCDVIKSARTWVCRWASSSAAATSGAA